MYPERTAPAWLIVLIAAGFVVLAYLFWQRSHSDTSGSTSAAGAEAEAEASSTVQQGIQLAAWLAKEYPQQKQ